MKKKLLILAALPVTTLWAAGYNGTLPSCVWSQGQKSSGAAISVEVKWADGSLKPNTTWSLDNGTKTWPVGTIVTGVSCAPHTVKFHPPTNYTGPDNHDFSCNSNYDDQKRVITVQYQ